MPDDGPDQSPDGSGRDGNGEPEGDDPPADTPLDGGLSGEDGFPDDVAAPPTDAALVVPGAVRAWLRDVDRRLAAVERRQAAEGTDPDPTLQVAVAGDRRALARVADRVESLVGRAQAVERRTGGDGRR